jgi:hypothetical protein
MGGSPFLWSELVDVLAHHTVLSRQQAEEWSDAAKSAGYTTQQAWENIPTWVQAGVSPSTIIKAKERAAA